MKCKELFSVIDSLMESYVSIWESACDIESPTDFKAGVDAVGELFASLARERGFSVEYFKQPCAGNVVCITMNPDAEGAPICLSGHMDTVHARGSFGTPRVRRDATKLYGPGVTDCKGGIVAGLLAMDALSRVGFTSRPVKLLLQSDEECNSIISNKETIKAICESAKNAIAFLNLEGHTRGEACLVRKGTITFTFTVKGITAHGAACADSGANAIAEAAYKILELEKLKDPVGITCNCGTIVGGTVPNTVPDFCEFKANIRFATREQLEWVRSYVREVADTVHIKGCTCTVDNPLGRVAMEYSERNVALLERMNEIYARNGLPILKMSMRGGASDAADVTSYGIPCVDSIGVTGGKIHTEHEYAELTSLTEAAKRIAAVIYCL